MHLKGALHVHTTCSDGDLSIEETIRAHETLGYDFLALTDHDTSMRPSCYDALYRIKTDVLVFTGTELSVFELGYCHVSRIPGDKEVLHVFNHPAQLDLSVAGIIERIQAVAGRLPLDAVEITANGYRTPEYDIPEIAYPKVATDDSHSKPMIGRAWIEMDSLREKDAIIQTIKRGDFRNCYRQG